MPELETLIRAAAPRPGSAPAGLEWRIWTALAAASSDQPLLAEPELVVDDPLPPRRPGHLGLLLGIAAAAAVLLTAVVVAGLRDHHGSRPAAGGHHTAPAAATPGRYYVEGTCPDESRGACFDPFPAGRYSFHKTNPQVTLAVPAGWRNDEAWPLEVVLSRPDTPGATLEILNDAHAVKGTGCRISPDPGNHTAAHLTTPMMHLAGFSAGGPDVARIGELFGYRVDLNASGDATGARCPDGTAGIPILTSPPDPYGNAGWVLALRPGESARIVLADGVGATGGRTVALVAIVRGGQTALQAWLAKAQPVIDSITFAPCTRSHTFALPCEDLRTSSP